MTETHITTTAPVPGTGSGPRAGDGTGLAELTANFRQYLLGWGEAERGEGDLDYYRSGLATPQFNGVVRTPSPEAVGRSAATARSRLAGVPWWWWVGPDSPEGTSAALARHGMAEFGSVPVMVRPLDGLVEAGERSDGLRIEAVEEPGRLTEFVRTYSASMGIAPDLEADMVRIEAHRADNADVVRLAAVLDGRIVGTTVVMAAHGVAGIFLVHVAEAHRRRGIGGVLTAAALHAGRERGMDRAALLASPAGEPLYRRFGFTAVSEYRLFALPA
ncbi:GNAT family N-acetyltransferase [Streptomyces sp. NPDC026673]|uniref:GNAT family N-acetyltransferase n=1 Tax=Streptomyces sp. NPDC026673 TaxID=3155724 RepID=UPI0033CC48E8